MKKEIIVIGLGHGGLVAAMKLAKAGYHVTILEAKTADHVSYPWEDDIRFDIFEQVGIPAPDASIYNQKTQRCFIAPDRVHYLPLPQGKPMEDISISRRGLIQHLTTLAEQAGVTIKYRTKVSELLVEGWKVVGVKAGTKKYKADLVIDASGFYSPFRGQVPSHFHMQAMPEVDGIMSVYRAIYEKVPGTETPHPERHYYIRHRGGAGISWCNVNNHDEVDVLVARIGELTKEEVKNSIADLKKYNPTLSEKAIVRGQYEKIALRSTISRMVSDGFALVGDSAFMTMPFMGSGIEASMTAGKLLAETVIEAGDVERYSAATLWPYQVAYYKALGAKYSFVDILKRWVLFLNPADLNWLFACGAVTPEDMLLVSTAKGKGLPFTPMELVRKVKILLCRPDIIGGAVATLLRGVLCMLTAKIIPKEYDTILVDLWQKLYEIPIPHKKMK